MANRCRFCGQELKHLFADLGISPLANSFLKSDELDRMEPHYPLRVYVCQACFLVQLPVYESPENIFGEYAYFSSFSESWLRHAKDYAARILERLGLDGNSRVIEIASNDGYLLQYFKERRIPVLGIEPARNVAKAAQQAGIPTQVEFFGTSLARRLAADGIYANLVIGNNVLAHVPDLNDFVRGMKIILKPNGLITMEFPHLLRLVEENQFDTIYHEHFSYFSFITVEKVFARHGLAMVDVEELSTHGGSLRIYAAHRENPLWPVSRRVPNLRKRETDLGLTRLEFYHSFSERVRKAKRDILEFLIRAKKEGKIIAGYGAPAKGNTLLNYCGVGTDFIEYTVDRSPHKQGSFLPGTHIPIYPPEKIRETGPDYLFILPWNLRDEIMEQMAHIREWGGRFVVPIPEIQIYT